MFDYSKIRAEIIESIEANGTADASEYDIYAIMDDLRDLNVGSIDEIDGYWDIVLAEHAL